MGLKVPPSTQIPTCGMLVLLAERKAHRGPMRDMLRVVSPGSLSASETSGGHTAIRAGVPTISPDDRWYVLQSLPASCRAGRSPCEPNHKISILTNR